MPERGLYSPVSPSTSLFTFEVNNDLILMFSSSVFVELLLSRQAQFIYDVESIHPERLNPLIGGLTWQICFTFVFLRKRERIVNSCSVSSCLCVQVFLILWESLNVFFSHITLMMTWETFLTFTWCSVCFRSICLYRSGQGGSHFLNRKFKSLYCTLLKDLRNNSFL